MFKSELFETSWLILSYLQKFNHLDYVKLLHYLIIMRQICTAAHTAHTTQFSLCKSCKSAQLLLRQSGPKRQSKIGLRKGHNMQHLCIFLNACNFLLSLILGSISLLGFVVCVIWYHHNLYLLRFKTLRTICLTTPVALHYTPVSRWVGGSEFRY